MFTWIKEKVKAAVLEGFNEAMQEAQQPVHVEPVTLELEYKPVELNGRGRVRPVTNC